MLFLDLFVGRSFLWGDSTCWLFKEYSFVCREVDRWHCIKASIIAQFPISFPAAKSAGFFLGGGSGFVVLINYSCATWICWYVFKSHLKAFWKQPQSGPSVKRDAFSVYYLEHGAKYRVCLNITEFLHGNDFFVEISLQSTCRLLFVTISEVGVSCCTYYKWWEAVISVS